MKGPLSSLKVLDFSTLLPGPFASLLLADMGAEVLRVESPSRMDLVRVLPPHDEGVSASHAYLNRNKRCIALDLKQAEAVALVKQLVAEYDIVLEQFRPGVMDKLGVGYEALKAINPRLIYVSITGYGQTGPYKDRAGHDINYLALAGIASYTGRRDRGPLPLGVQLADIAGGSLHGVMGLLAAVIQRQVTGEGQRVDVSMTDCAFSLHGMAGAGFLADGVEPQMENQVLNGGSFYDYYRSRDGRWFSVGSLEPHFMQQFCTALGRPELAARGLARDRNRVRETRFRRVEPAVRRPGCLRGADAQPKRGRRASADQGPWPGHRSAAPRQHPAGADRLPDQILQRPARAPPYRRGTGRAYRAGAGRTGLFGRTDCRTESQ
jgi:crotonobetainyl-CoA:carnitine CoA-transferase CaiB-like acyl-CoA transferase